MVTKREWVLTALLVVVMIFAYGWVSLHRDYATWYNKILFVVVFPIIPIALLFKKGASEPSSIPLGPLGSERRTKWEIK